MEKAPGSGGPAAGKPEGVKSGDQLMREVREQVQSGNAPIDQVAPAEATIRATSKDGSADPDHEITADSQAEADENLAKETQKLDKQANKQAKADNAETERQANESAETQRRIAETARGRQGANREPVKGR